MCGITGYVGHRSAAPIVLQGIMRNLYRGYDAAGMAVVSPQGPQILRVVGPGSEVLSQKLDEMVRASPPVGTTGIGHNRWATHGGLTTENTHPHADCDKRIILVHNGTVSHVDELKQSLLIQGHAFTSHTDTEALAHLIEQGFKDGLTMLEVLRVRLATIAGTYALAIIDVREPDRVYVARRESPLILGVGEGEMFIGSDPVSFLDYTHTAILLDNGEYGVVMAEGATIYNANGELVRKTPTRVERSADAADRGGHAHFMLKEILEQPTVMRTVMHGRLDVEAGTVQFPERPDLATRLAEITHLTVVASGSSYWAGAVAERLFESMTHVPVKVVPASEFSAGMARALALMPGRPGVAVISQSGETADVIAALRILREAIAGLPAERASRVYTLGIINVEGSTLSRLVDDVIYTRAGTEVSVASTKAFVAQVTVFCLIALLLGRMGQVMTDWEAKAFARALWLLPEQMVRSFDGREAVRALAGRYATFHHLFFLGRGLNAPMAAEGALKLKEIAYLHAEAYPTGELKHGPLALTAPEFAMVMLCPQDEFYALNEGAVSQITTRGGPVIALTSQANEALSALAQDVIVVPATDLRLWPLMALTVMQLFAYYVAIERGHNPDQPRHLAKSVTVQ